MTDIEFANGIYFNKPHQNAPSFVLGQVSIQPNNFLQWLQRCATDEKGYVRLDVKESKNGKVYLALNTWKPTESRGNARSASSTYDLDDDDFAPPF